MKIQQVNHTTLSEAGYKINKMPKRGYAIRTCDDVLFVFRKVGSSWRSLIRSIMNAFSYDRHLKVVICVLPCSV